MLTCILSSHMSSHCGITYLHLYIIVPLYCLLNVAYCLILYHSNHFSFVILGTYTLAYVLLLYSCYMQNCIPIYTVYRCIQQLTCMGYMHHPMDTISHLPIMKWQYNS